MRILSHSVTLEKEFHHNIPEIVTATPHQRKIFHT